MRQKALWEHCRDILRAEARAMRMTEIDRSLRRKGVSHSSDLWTIMASKPDVFVREGSRNTARWRLLDPSVDGERAADNVRKAVSPIVNQYGVRAVVNAVADVAEAMMERGELVLDVDGSEMCPEDVRTAANNLREQLW